LTHPEPSDQAFVVHFDVHADVLQTYASSPQDLAAALAQLKVPSALSTLLYDAIRECSENRMRKKEGRKAFILLSDGVNFYCDRICEARRHDYLFDSLR
jgi:hypothetical protein